MRRYLIHQRPPHFKNSSVYAVRDPEFTVRGGRVRTRICYVALQRKPLDPHT